MEINYKSVWLIGLSGAGKSTLAKGIFSYLKARKINTIILDGDDIRNGLNSDLGYSRNDRRENIRRITEVSRILLDNGIIPIVSVICPYEEDREFTRNIIGKEKYLQVFVDCPLKICEERDPKGLYKKAKSGLIKGFTGLHSPFETPKRPDFTVNTFDLDYKRSLNTITKYIISQLFGAKTIV